MGTTQTKAGDPDTIQLESCTVDLRRRRVHRGDETDRLTPKEAELLGYFVAHPNRVVSREELLREVWGYHEESQSRTADTAIRTLRRKVERDPSEPDHIRSKYGEGYLFIPADGSVQLEVATADSGSHRGRALRGMTNLAPTGAPTVGRAVTLEKLLRTFSEGYRLVTVLGGPGMGKTTIARHFAEQAFFEASPPLDVAFDEAWFCDLTSAQTAPEIVDIVSRILGIGAADTSTIEDTIERVGRELARRSRTLLILDNFEQLTAFAVETVGSWIARAPELFILVTSRERLRLQDEFCCPLPPLERADAMSLYIARAAALGVEVSTEDTRELGQLVEELDGIPLAIELAAARARLMGPSQLRGRLAQRLTVLSAPYRDVPKRHRTLAMAIDWSWDLLTQTEQDVFAQLSTFRGSFSLEEAEAVVEILEEDAPGIPLAIESLMDKSLIHTTQGSASRFALYEILRVYGQSQLHASAALRTATELRHAKLFVAEGESIAGALRLQGVAALADTHPELLANLNAAITRSLEQGEQALATRAALCLVRVGAHRGVSIQEKLQQLERLLPHADGLEPGLKAELFFEVGDLLRRDRPPNEAQSMYEQALDVACAAGASSAQAAAMNGLAKIHVRAGKFPQAFALVSGALALEEVDPQTRAELVLRGGGIHGRNGDMDECERWLSRALQLARSAGCLRTLCLTITNIASLRSMQGRFSEAENALSEALRIAHETGDLSMRGQALAVLVWVQFNQGEVAAAYNTCTEALEPAHRLGMRASEAHGLVIRALIGFFLGDLSSVRVDVRAATDIGVKALNREVLTSLALLNHALGDYPAAIAMYERLLERSTDEPTWSSMVILAHAMRAGAEAARGDATAARRSLDLASPHMASADETGSGLFEVGTALCGACGVPIEDMPDPSAVIERIDRECKVGPFSVIRLQLLVASRILAGRLEQ